MGVSQGATDNLMDYADGQHLAVWQWNLISTHKNYTVPFLTDEEDGWRKINGFSVQISEPDDYDGRKFIYDDGGSGDYSAINNAEFKSCYQQFDGKYIPLILVARGRTAKFKLMLKHDKPITDNDLQYDFMVEMDIPPQVLKKLKADDAKGFAKVINDKWFNKIFIQGE